MPPQEICEAILASLPHHHVCVGLKIASLTFPGFGRENGRDLLADESDQTRPCLARILEDAAEDAEYAIVAVNRLA